MKILGDASEIDVAWEWGRAEVESSRFGEGYGFLDPRIRAALRVGSQEDLTAEELNRVHEVVRLLRRPLLEDLFRLGTSWKKAEMELSEVRSLRVINWPPLVQIDPTRTIDAISRFLARGGIPPDKAFGKAYSELRPVFSLDKMRGQPLLIAETIAGPYAVLEGYTRLSVIASAFRAQELPDGLLRIILGICSKVRDWRLWQQRLDRSWNRTAHVLW